MLGILKLFINIILTAIEFLLTARFILKFFSVKSSSGFANWIYDATDSLIAPFLGIINPWKLGNFSFDFTTLIALFVYALAGGLIVKIISRLDRG
jgi:uncharacterized protein YggT (Ycf19 family)